jgi:hypothetical protein
MADKIKAPDLNSEVAPRSLDPHEVAYQGIIRTSDPVLLEHGGDIAIYRDLARDDAISRSLNKRIASLLGREWWVETEDKGPRGAAAAERITQALRATPWEQGVRSLMDALLIGWSPVECVWTRREDGLIAPARLIQRSHRRFVFVENDDDPEGRPELRLLTRDAMLRGIALPPRSLIVHRHRARDDNPYGLGMGFELYWLIYFKRRGMVAWARRNDRFSSPTPWGRYPASASPAEKGTLAQALKAFSTDGYIMTPEGMQIGLLEAAASGAIAEAELLYYMDDAIDGILLGQEPARKTSAAPGAAATERQAVRLDLVQSDADELSNTLNASLLRWICEINGLPPCNIWWKVEDESDTKRQAETDSLVAQHLGYRPTPERIAEHYGEGWEPIPQPTAHPIGPAFGEEPIPDPHPGEAESDPPRKVMPELEAAADVALGEWIEEVRGWASDAATLPDLLDRLRGAELETERMGQIIGDSSALAAAMGRADVLDEVHKRKPGAL